MCDGTLLQMFFQAIPETKINHNVYITAQHFNECNFHSNTFTAREKNAKSEGLVFKD